MTDPKRPRRLVLNEELTLTSTDNAVHVAVGYEVTSIDPHDLEHVAHWVDTARRYFRRQAKQSQRSARKGRGAKRGA
jgi:hypothetical protein